MTLQVGVPDEPLWQLRQLDAELYGCPGTQPGWTTGGAGDGLGLGDGDGLGLGDGDGLGLGEGDGLGLGDGDGLGLGEGDGLGLGDGDGLGDMAHLSLHS